MVTSHHAASGKAESSKDRRASIVFGTWRQERAKSLAGRGDCSHHVHAAGGEADGEDRNELMARLMARTETSIERAETARAEPSHLQAEKAAEAML